MIKGIIFDFGGVIMRTEDHRPRHAWDERLGLPTGSVERAIHHSDLWIQAQLGRITDEAYWNGVAEMLYMSRDLIPELRRDYFSGDRLNYRLLDLIRDLRTQAYKIALLSNESLQLTNKLRELGIDELFDHVLISAHIGVMKPDPTAYRVALQTLQVKSLETVFIDDSLVNVRAAQTLGIRGILYRSGTEVREELKQHLDDSSGR